MVAESNKINHFTQIIGRNDSFLLNSRRIPMEPNKRYKLSADILCNKGNLYSAYIAVIILGSTGREIRRFIRWIKDGKEQRKYTVIFSSPPDAKNAIVGYRINVETPATSYVKLVLPDINSLRLQETGDKIDSFDDLKEVTIPASRPLTEEEEKILESKLVWLFGSGRSGTTWLGAGLLNHADNIIWFEPEIGVHLGVVSAPDKRLYDVEANAEKYFFSQKHKNYWLFPLRKLILARAYSHTWTIQKNLIIKEPHGSHAADILMECLPKSKLIFLLRDGRDVVDSELDTHRPDSWGQQFVRRPTLLTRESRLQAIKTYSMNWKMKTDITWRAYKNHDPSLRLLVKYEDLRKNTLEELKRIYDFLNIKISHQELRDIVERNTFERIPEIKKGPGKFYRSATPGGWKNNFNHEEKQLMNSIMSQTLVEMSYDV